MKPRAAGKCKHEDATFRYRPLPSKFVCECGAVQVWVTDKQPPEWAMKLATDTVNEVAINDHHGQFGAFFPDGHEPVFRMIELVARTLEAAAQEGCTHVGVGSMLEQGRRAGIEEAARVAETMPKLWAGFSDHKSHSERGPCWCLAIASQIRLLAGKGEREK